MMNNLLEENIQRILLCGNSTSNAYYHASSSTAPPTPSITNPETSQPSSTPAIQSNYHNNQTAALINKNYQQQHINYCYNLFLKQALEQATMNNGKNSTTTTPTPATPTTNSPTSPTSLINQYNQQQMNPLFLSNWCLWMLQHYHLHQQQQFQTLLKTTSGGSYNHHNQLAIAAAEAAGLSGKLATPPNNNNTNNAALMFQQHPQHLIRQQLLTAAAASINHQQVSASRINDTLAAAMSNNRKQQTEEASSTSSSLSSSSSSSCSSTSTSSASYSSIRSSTSPPLAQSSSTITTNVEAKTEKTTVSSSSSSLLLECDWPGCDGRFPSEEILNHHRRFHIRKSNYHCKHCLVRLLTQEELIEHEQNGCKTANGLNDRKQIHQQPLVKNNHEDGEMARILTKNSINKTKSYNNHNLDNVRTTTVLLNGSNTGNGAMVTDPLFSDDYFNNNEELSLRKSLIDQLIAPKNSKIKKRDLKRALLSIRSMSSSATTNDHGSMMTAAHDPNDHNQTTSNAVKSPSSPSSASSSNGGKPSSPSSALTVDQSLMMKRTRYSGIGRYPCPWPDCTYTPHFLRDLRRHMYKHTGDKRYKCPHCRFGSVWKTSLLQHLRKKHSSK